MSPKIDLKQCDQCGTCISVCAFDALTLTEELLIDSQKCSGCKKCISVCPVGALLENE